MWHAIAHGDRLQPWRWLFALCLVLSTLTRCALLIRTGGAIDPTAGRIALMLAVGLGFDLAAIGFLLTPVVLALTWLPVRWQRRRAGRMLILAGAAGWAFFALFLAVAEWVFWDEFGTRFNFIAVDYLVYTHEVLANVWESYPIGWILAGLAALSAAVVWRQRHAICRDSGWQPGWRTDTVALLVVVLFPALVWAGIAPVRHPFANRYANELAANGIYEFFHAFNDAELDYDRFYPRISTHEAFARVRRLQPPTAHLGPASPNPGALARTTRFAAPPRPLNVVLISVESLSAAFMAHFGNRQGITPVLDRLAEESVFFTNFYATGTRTVRGLEALSLSVPPTPGESIVKRPQNGGLATVGAVLSAQGYEASFVYGGYARFDNMGPFFGGNGYTVVDRTDIPDERIHHENAWGVADEDVYTQALEGIGRAHARGQPAFVHVMTTSNHRPYTYPDGRIDLPSGHGGRPGAVKYTDWAIGDFITRAKRESWFDNTVFVIVADHCASSAGKTELPLHRYHIPLLIYAPKLLSARRVDELASQIDVVPTILGLLRVPYTAPFFGRDLLEPVPSAPYAFVSTYQELGFLRGGHMVELSPQKQPAVRTVDRHVPPLTAPDARALTSDAIALYQVAADAFKSGALRYVAVDRPPAEDSHGRFVSAR